MAKPIASVLLFSLLTAGLTALSTFTGEECALAAPRADCPTCAAEPVSKPVDASLRTPIERVIKEVAEKAGISAKKPESKPGTTTKKPAKTAKNQLSAFISDGCSSFPDGTPSEPKKWLKCCVIHDIAYWQGGTREERHKADEKLRDCVAATGATQIAQTMFAGVRVGGKPGLPTSWRWGYGWKIDRGYAPLTKAELAQVRKWMKKIPQNLDLVPLSKPLE